MQLHRVQPGLTFEFGPKEQEKREFVISADGIKDVFPAVISLAKAAPTLARWKITKFRPRRSFQSAVSLNGLQISPGQLKFTIEPDGDKAGITLFIEGYTSGERDRYAAVVLDQTLGEYDIENQGWFHRTQAKLSSLEVGQAVILSNGFSI